MVTPMLRRGAALALVALVAPVAAAAPQAGIAAPSVDAELLQRELIAARDALRLPDSAAPYHLRAVVGGLHTVQIQARAGGLIWSSPKPAVWMGLELRVGEPAWDNTGLSGLFGTLDDGLLRVSLPVEPDPTALRLALWRATDVAYKQAVENLARKDAQVVRPDDYPGDLSPWPVVVADEGEARATNAAALEALAVDLSGVWRDEPRLTTADVLIGHEAGWRLVVDTDGTRVRRPSEETTLAAVVRTRADDGMLLEDWRRWIVRDPGALDVDAIRAELRAMGDDLLALADAPTLDEEVIGPVLFEGDAAAALFDHLMTGALLGTPQEADFESIFGDFGGGGATSGRLLRRLLPPGWRVEDDPTASPTHPGAWAYDDEGVPAQALTLVEDGVVRDLAMSRVPRTDLRASNGHGRSNPGQRAVGRLSLTTVTAPKALPETALRRKALKAAAAYGRDWVFVVRRLDDPSVAQWDTDLWFSPADVPLPPPLALERLYADGRVERVRGASFSSVERYVLRDVLAAGRPVSIDVMRPFEPGTYETDPLSGLPGRVTAPSVLIGELELVPRTGDASEIPLLPPLASTD